MKKALCILLSFIMLLSFVACGKNKTNSDSEIDLEYYANLGKIPECSYSLGEDVDKVCSELSKEAESGQEDITYTLTEGEKTVLIDNGTFLYSYVKEKKNNGISFIVDYGNAFGFETGTVSVEVKDTLSAYEYSEETASDKYAFFLNGNSECSVVKYKFDNYNIIFVFEDNALFATAIFDSDNWL